jgi:hypothetical protein
MLQAGIKHDKAPGPGITCQLTPLGGFDFAPAGHPLGTRAGKPPVRTASGATM